MTGHPVADRTVLSAILHRHALERPDALFAHFPDAGSDTDSRGGTDSSETRSWTYAQTLVAAQRAAAGLHSLGVGRGDRVLCWLPNGEAFLRCWFGVSYLGAVHTPINLAWRGRMLENALALSQASVAVVHADLLPRLAEIDRHALRHVIVVGAINEHSDTGLALYSADLLENGSLPVLQPDTSLEPWDDAQLIFTSGTTGASKAVICSYAHCSAFLLPDCLPENFGADETFLVVVPLFHAGGASGVYSQLICGGSIALPARFQSDRFWPIVRQCRVTTTTLLGVMTPFLLSAPPTPADRDHPLKVVSVAPLNNDALTFGERFGVRLWTSYGASEIGAVLSCEGNVAHLGAAGKLRAAYQARLVDDHDFEVPAGAIGELVVRADHPWTFFSGYCNNPEATASTNRNGWYHTGDLMRTGDNGLFYFTDRKKDSIRRRGENISSLEVEAEIACFEGVREVAAYAVAASHAEDEVMICVSFTNATDADWTKLVEFLRTRIPHYMMPRYCRHVPELPKTETGKIRKELLREQGITADTWDREAAGIVLKGERINT